MSQLPQQPLGFRIGSKAAAWRCFEWGGFKLVLSGTNISTRSCWFLWQQRRLCVSSLALARPRSLAAADVGCSRAESWAPDVQPARAVLEMSRDAPSPRLLQAHGLTLTDSSCQRRVLCKQQPSPCTEEKRMFCQVFSTRIKVSPEYLFDAFLSMKHQVIWKRLCPPSCAYQMGSQAKLVPSPGAGCSGEPRVHYHPWLSSAAFTSPCSWGLVVSAACMWPRALTLCSCW